MSATRAPVSLGEEPAIPSVRAARAIGRDSVVRTLAERQFVRYREAARQAMLF